MEAEPVKALKRRRGSPAGSDKAPKRIDRRTARERESPKARRRLAAPPAPSDSGSETVAATATESETWATVVARKTRRRAATKMAPPPAAKSKPKTAATRKPQVAGKKPPTPAPRRRQRRSRPQAVLIEVPVGSTFVDTYKGVCAKAREELVDARAIRKTKQGHVLIEMVAGADTEKRAAAIKEATGFERVRLMQPRAFLEIRNIDPLAEEAELRTAVSAHAGCAAETVTVKAMRATPWGSLTALVETDAVTASKIALNPRIRVGFTVASAREIPRVIRCYRCQSFGHIAVNCRNLQAGKEVCRRCGSTEHPTKDCKAKEPKCILCSRNGLVGAAAQHIAGSAKCPEYKKRTTAGRSAR